MTTPASAPTVAAPSDPNQASVYERTTQHWAHAEQIRWTLLYNYLMASTILLLAWSTIFAGSCTGKRLVLIALSASGVFLSLLWVALGARATGFVTMYEEIGRAAELALGVPGGPFAKAHQHRSSIRGASFKQIAWAAPSWFVLRCVPLLFFALYSLLTWVS